MKIISEHCTSYRLSKDFELELDNGEIIEFYKSIIESDEDTSNDWGFINNGKEIFDKLPEEEQEKVEDFIYELEI